MSSAIAAVVVAYHPARELVNNISSFIGVVDRVYIYLNSEIQNELKAALESEFAGKVIYLGDSQNQGIAIALNRGAEMALAEGYDWLLTMDQDSQFFEFGGVDVLEQTTSDLLYPLYRMGGDVMPADCPPWIMTSGNFIRLATWEKLGGFEEKYFIDGVDTEYCMKLKYFGHSFQLMSGFILQHNLGESLANKVLLGLSFRVTNHTSFRHYFCVRNYLDLAGRYIFLRPHWSLFLIWVLCLRLFKVAFFETSKIEKLKFGARGIRDCFLRRFGAGNSG